MELLTSTDARRIYSLLEECGELWDDPRSWQCHMAASLQQAVGGFGGRLLLHGADRVLEVGAGPLDDASRVHLQAFVANGGPRLLPGYDGVLRQLDGQSHVCCTCASWVGEGVYYRSEIYQRYMRPVYARHTLFASAKCESKGLLVSAALSRESSDPPFSARDQAILGSLASALAPRIGRKLTTRSQRGRHLLSPRESQTLDALLQGDSEKQVAARLGLSQLTIHDYVKALYRCFDVKSRGELMAYFLRRAPKSTSLRARKSVRDRRPEAIAIHYGGPRASDVHPPRI